MVHRVFAGGGSCFSSPCLLSCCPLVCIATLRGNICGVNSVSTQSLQAALAVPSAIVIFL